MDKDATGIVRAEKYGDRIKVIMWDKKRDLRFEASFLLEDLINMPDLSESGKEGESWE